MVSKIFEVRDEATNIGVLATRIKPEVDAEEYEILRTGYASGRLVIVTTLASCKSANDPHEWRKDGTRTMFEAHRYIEEHFDELNSGDVVDVRYILGETDAPAKSDKYFSTLLRCF